MVTIWSYLHPIQFLSNDSIHIVYRNTMKKVGFFSSFPRKALATKRLSDLSFVTIALGQFFVIEDILIQGITRKESS
jgi:hypothetical protein